MNPSENPTIPDTMRALVLEGYGLANLHLKELETPAPTDDRVLVRVEASSINAYDWHMAAGKPYFMRLMNGLTKPKTSGVGADLSGTVVAVGPDVTRFSVGDEVLGDIGSGAYAGYALTREGNLALKPAGVSFEDAAAAPLAGLTALQGLRDAGSLVEGQRVLIIGASGGVGTYAVQIAKAMGAHVTAVCSTRNVETASELGADVVIDYTQEDFTSSAGGYDLIFDGPATTPLRALRRLLKENGTYVMVGGPKGTVIGPIPRLMRTILAFRFSSRNFPGIFMARVVPEDLEQLGTLLESGAVRSVIAERIGLEEVVDALDRQGGFHATGKTVVTIRA